MVSNKLDKLANTRATSQSIANKLPPAEKEKFYKLSKDLQTAYENYCMEHKNQDPIIIDDFLKLNKKETPSVIENKIEEVSKENNNVQATETENIEHNDKEEQKNDFSDLLSNISIPKKEPGKVVGFYLSKDTYDKLESYLKKNKIKNKSAFFEALLKQVL